MIDVLGKELWDKVSNTKLLVVGAGGIGCELLKNLVHPINFISWLGDVHSYIIIRFF